MAPMTAAAELLSSPNAASAGLEILVEIAALLALDYR
jgi:hypothetical protein